MQTFEIAQLNFYDVDVVLVFLDTQFDAATPRQRQDTYATLQECLPQNGLTGNLMLVWQDHQGVTKFIAPSQQHPFFQTMTYDQLHAQVNQTRILIPSRH